MKKIFVYMVTIPVVALLLLYFRTTQVEDTKVPEVVIENVGTQETIVESETEPTALPTERYSAQVDRVKVVFEQWDYTKFRLQTNELVREGDMNTERGFEDDIDATIYVLNWRAPEGEQIRYVRLTAEPAFLYVLDGYQNIIRSGRLVLEE